MFFAAARLYFEVSARDAEVNLSIAFAIWLAAVSYAAGVLYCLLGAGGGVFMVPVMVIFFSISELTANAVSLLVLIQTSLLATYFSMRRGNLHVKSAALVGIPGAATSPGGAALAFLLNPQLASILLAAFLVVVAIRMAFHAVKKYQHFRIINPKGKSDV